MGRAAFDEGDELQVVAADGFEEAVDFERGLGIEAVDDGEGVEFHAVFL